MVPKAPYLFDSGKNLIPNNYSEYSSFTVYVSDKNVFGNIDDDNEVYYTFSDISADTIVEGTNPETSWVKVNKLTQSIEITKNRTMRLITDKMGELSDVSWYYLGVKPAAVTSSCPSGEYEEKIDLTLSCPTSGAKILYTLNGSDPISNGMEYGGTITIAKDTTLRAVAVYEGEYSDISSFYYLIKTVDDFGMDAFYPPGVYEGSVNVTLTPNNPENSVKYSIDNGNTWLDYDNVLVIDKDTDIIAKAVDASAETRAVNIGLRIKLNHRRLPLHLKARSLPMRIRLQYIVPKAQTKLRTALSCITQQTAVTQSQAQHA